MMMATLLAAALLAEPVKPDLDAFREARFGMFVHWGLYAQLGGRYKGKSMEAIGEWIQSRYRIPNAEYSLLAKEFNPVRFDADAWAKAAKAAGMEYVVFTTKHHEGFAMFATKVSDYNVVDATPFGRDVFGELAAACRRNGLKVGVYYSQCLDWHEFDAADVVERRRGNRGNIRPPEPGMDWGNAWDWPDASKKDIRRYLKAKVYPQLKELLTNYGDIFLIWFDTAMGLTEAETRELREYVRSLSPKTVVNSRIGFDLGDFGSMGDNQLMSGKSDFARECPITLNDTWGFKYDDHNWKSAYEVATFVAQTVACNANILLNVGPRPDGAIPEPSLDVLAELAAWRRKTGFRIRGTKASPFSGELPWGWCTVADGNVLQFVVRRDWTNDLEVSGIRNRVKACTAPYGQEDAILRIRLSPSDDMMPRVVRVTLDGAPDVDRRIQPQNGIVKLQPSDGVVTAGGPVAGDEGFIGVDAVKMGGGRCAISRNGSFASWHHPGDGIAWRVAFPKAGRYRVWLRTENTNHSAPWSGERKVRLMLGETRVVRDLKADRTLPSTVYARAETDLGVVEVKAPGELEVSVTTLEAHGAAHSHDLTLVTLEAAGEAVPAPAKAAGAWRGVKPAIAPGKVKVCMDWDDSCFTDFRLAELCRKYKAKATFNITPRAYSDHCYMRRETTERNGTTYHFKSPEGFDRARTVSIPYITNEGFKYCYEGLRVAAHLNMRYGDTPDDLAYSRRLMEEFLAVAPDVTGQDGFGIVWSGGRWSPGIVRIAKELGFRYCRGANTYEKPGKWGEWTIQPATYWSEPPEKFWEWYELAKRRGDVFWFWGHTQDLGYDDAIWARLEGIIRRISEDPDAEWIDVGDLAGRE